GPWAGRRPASLGATLPYIRRVQRHRSGERQSGARRNRGQWLSSTGLRLRAHLPAPGLQDATRSRPAESAAVSAPTSSATAKGGESVAGHFWCGGTRLGVPVGTPAGRGRPLRSWRGTAAEADLIEPSLERRRRV